MTACHSRRSTMKSKRKVRFHVPAAIAFTIVTGIHTVAAWAADGGADAGSASDAGADASNADAGRERTSCGANKDDEEAHRSTVTLFGSGCC